MANVGIRWIVWLGLLAAGVANCAAPVFDQFLELSAVCPERTNDPFDDEEDAPAKVVVAAQAAGQHRKANVRPCRHSCPLVLVIRAGNQLVPRVDLPASRFVVCAVNPPLHC